MTTELLNALYAQIQGTDLRLDQDTLRIHLPDTPGRRTLPLRRLNGIVVYGHINLSTALITRCPQDKRPVTWMSRDRRYLARLDGAVHGNVLLRHAQHQRHDNTDARLGIALNIVAGKIRNSRWILLRAARDAAPARQEHIRNAAEDLAAAIDKLGTAESIDVCEGHGLRVQKSVFEIVADEKTLLELLHDLDQIIESDTDSIRLYRLPADGFNHVQTLGIAQIQPHHEDLVL